MYKKLLLFILLLVFGGFTQTVNAQQNYLANEVIVLLKNNISARLFLENYNQTNPGENLVSKQLLSKRTNTWLLTFDSNAIAVPDLLAKLSASENVLIAQPNHNNITSRSTTPNDLDYPIQWSLNGLGGGKISANLAWDISTGGPTALGDTIVIAIVDGGADIQHVDLDFFKNKHEIPGNGIDDDNNGYIDDYDGWNAYNNNGIVGSDNHGTHVCGIAGAKTNNVEGIAGVMWNAKLMPVAGSSNIESVVLAAYGYVLEMRAKYNESNGDSGAFVVVTNSSFGVNFARPSDYPIWCAFYDSLGAYGILNTAATANLGIDVDIEGDIPTTCPSNYMIAVTNVNISGSLMGAYGDTNIDLAAPGTDIYSTTPNQTYGSQTGTSMASPHVAGAVGLMYSAICSGTLNQYIGHPDSLALWVRDVLINGGVDSLPALIGKVQNSGRLNLQKCLENIRMDNCMEFARNFTDDYCGDCAGSITVHVSGEFPPYTVTLISLTDTLTGDTIYDNLCTGPYSIMVEDATGYTKIVAVYIDTEAPILLNYTITPAGSPTSSDGAIAALVTGGYPAYDYVWSTGDTTPAIQNVPAGSYTLLVKDDKGCSVFDTVYLYTVGIDEKTGLDSELHFYPNPASAILNISVTSSQSGNSNNMLEVLDYLGRVVLQIDLLGKTALTVDVSGLPSGVYLLRYNGREAGKLLLNR